MLLLLVPGLGMGGSPMAAAVTIILICLIAQERSFMYSANNRVNKFIALARK